MTLFGATRCADVIGNMFGVSSEEPVSSSVSLLVDCSIITWLHSSDSVSVSLICSASRMNSLPLSIESSESSVESSIVSLTSPQGIFLIGLMPQSISSESSSEENVIRLFFSAGVDATFFPLLIFPVKAKPRGSWDR